MLSNKSHEGVLHNYAPRLVAFEYTTSPDTSNKPNSLLFIGGLTDGLETVPYVSKIAQALEPTEWSLFSLLLSSSYGGWAVGSLDNDVEEIAQCVEYVKKVKGSHGKVVVMGHSTGSQDVLHYLHSPNPLPRSEGYDSGLQHLVRPVLDGAIMQAPASDREALIATLKKNPELQGVFDELVALAKSEPYTTGKTGDTLPLALTAKLDFPPDTAISGRRFLSLASPDSPERPAPDDLFSSDLSDERLLQTFGAVGSRGLLRSKLMALYSGEDEFAAPWIEKEKLLERWSVAADANGENKWDHGDSGVIAGASHNVKDVGQGDLITQVLNYLSRV
ncbi:hypothetical protein ASPWEDRAFT_25025 [Aspergillus wentii DTO 134E9]|uniref:Dolichol-phosphate mannosyltransferase n=1 Tax=Aspergillus wentii DTO 134E9 TaxID=1073089 RepID=A0A1L9RW70_ASPWE|nr:uncharacterized protein ASPWEDRAFT_25025 [Aspergillus wentii DTO 134E9]KAI9929131.1 hypothetical protein MW887_001535 [Aspergillus wentii]OJJ39172.1 hypothetical protein ASPWEDRAFT_25025 [Aspergillus wentii DTO 134E9]